MKFDSYPCLAPVPASFIEQAVPYSVERLTELIDSNTEPDPNLFLARGNLYLSQENFQKAADDYSSLLEAEPEDLAANINLAIAKLNIGNTGGALSVMEDASASIGVDDKFADRLAYHLALANSRKGKFAIALSKLEEISVPDPIVSGLKGGVLLKLKREEQASKSLKMAHKAGIENGVPELLLALRANSLDEKFKAKNLRQLALELRDIHSEFGNRFFGNKDISQALEKLAKEIIDSGQREKIIRALNLNFHGHSPSSPSGNAQAADESLQDSVLILLFSLGLVPEFYLEEDELEETINRWQKALVDRGEHPYAHFMVALVYFYRGDFEVALDRFQICSDKLLPKKKRSLRLDDLESLNRSIIRPVNVNSQGSNASDLAWRDAGFLDDFTIRLWKKFGFEPEEATPWHDKSIHPKVASACHRLKLSPDAVDPYAKAGLQEAREIRTWLAAEIEPEVAVAWAEEFTGNVSDAVQYLNLGVKGPEEANKWTELFSIPSTASPWLQADHSPEETKECLDAGQRSPEPKVLDLEEAEQENSTEE